MHEGRPQRIWGYGRQLLLVLASVAVFVSASLSASVVVPLTLTQLTRAGYLERRHPAGTFVRQQQVIRRPSCAARSAGNRGRCAGTGDRLPASGW